MLQERNAHRRPRRAVDVRLLTGLVGTLIAVVLSVSVPQPEPAVTVVHALAGGGA